MAFGPCRPRVFCAWHATASRGAGLPSQSHFAITNRSEYRAVADSAVTM
jgi:hypothetical protein